MSPELWGLSYEVYLSLGLNLHNRRRNLEVEEVLRVCEGVWSTISVRLPEETWKLDT